MIASHSYWDLCGLYGIAAGSFYSEAGPLWPTLYAIHDALRGEIFFDVSPEACNAAAAGFSPFSRGQMDQCVCAVDGLVIRTRQVYLLLFPFTFLLLQKHIYYITNYLLLSPKKKN
jgi:hypothetical protein